MFRLFLLVPGFYCFYWLSMCPAVCSRRIFQSASDELVIPNCGHLQQITCVHNHDSIPLAGDVISYEIGAVKTNQRTDEKTSETMHEAAVSLAYKQGFSKISSLQLKASYKFQSKNIEMTSTMKTSTTSQTMKFKIPEIAPHSSWCAYQLQTVAWPSSHNEEFSFLFRDIITTPGPIDTELTRSDLVIQGEKQKWDSQNGYLLYTQQWGNGDQGWFMYMQDNGDGNVRAWEGDPGGQGHLIFEPVGSDTFRLSPTKWANWYLYMQDEKYGNVRGWKGVPGPQGEFVVKPHPYKSCYLISTKKWPHWYVYMQDRGDGNVRGWEGDPGSQGCWRMEEAYT